MRDDQDRVEVRQATDEEQRESLADALSKLNKAIEEGAADLTLAPALGVNDFEGNYPIAVNEIRCGAIGAMGHREVGAWVGVRPVGEEYKDQTFLGVLLGDLPVTPMIRYRPTTGEMLVAMRDNPAIWVPDLNRIVWGMESWWAVIESPEHLKEITNADIESVWYVQALKAIGGQAEATCEHCGAPCEYDSELCLCERCQTEANDGEEGKRDEGVEQ